MPDLRVDDEVGYGESPQLEDVVRQAGPQHVLPVDHLWPLLVHGQSYLSMKRLCKHLIGFNKGCKVT